MTQQGTESYDLIVIGGGCNGTGIARDAAMRGIRTLLLEKDDFGSGTTGRSSRMIHGGLRYMLHDTRTTYLSCLDSGYIQQIAPHLLLRIPFLVPYFESRGNLFKRVWKNRIYPVLMEAFFKGYDRYQPLKNGKPSTHLNRAEALRLEPGMSEEVLGCLTMDEWWIDVFRLCLLNALSAQQHGATVENGAQVTRLLRGEGGQVLGVEYRSHGQEGLRQARATLTFNAAGPWSPQVAKMAGAQLKLRPGKGTHLVVERRLTNWGVITPAVDGRSVFMMPNDDTTLIGTTDDDFYGKPDGVFPSHDEILYLLEGIARVFPSIRQARLIRAFSGLRPTLFAWGRNEDDLSRAHRIFDHQDEGAPGLLSIAGGKLASFRIMAEEATDAIAKRLDNTTPCTTHKTPLPGGEHTPDARALAQEFELPEYPVRRLILRHGSIARSILEEGKTIPNGFCILCDCQAIMLCELHHVLSHELVQKPSDLLRRTGISQGPCMGMRCAMTVARTFCEHRTSSHHALDEAYWELRQALWAQQAPILLGGSLQQATLHHALAHPNPNGEPHETP